MDSSFLIFDNTINNLYSEIEKEIKNITTTETMLELSYKIDDNEILCDDIAEINYKLILNKTMNLTDCKNTNLFDIDIKFMKQGYNLYDYTNDQIINYVKNNNFINYIFHPKQLYNLFNYKIKILITDSNIIYIKFDNKYYKINNFIKYIDNYSYDTFKELTIREIENRNFVNNNLLLLVYIGSDIDIDIIIDKIKMYHNIETFSIAFCIHFKLINSIISIITQNFKNNFIIYSSNEFGTDIIPSLLVYNEIINKYNFNYIIKIHTKSDKIFLYEAVDYLLKNNLNNLLLEKNKNSSSIGFKYIKNKDDIFNKKLYSKFNNILNNNEFVPGTIFLTTPNIMNNVLSFLKDNYKIILFQNMYDNNSLNKDYSYVHFMERLFGYL